MVSHGFGAGHRNSGVRLALILGGCGGRLVFCGRIIRLGRVNLAAESPCELLQFSLMSNSSRWRSVNRFAFQRPDLQGDVLPISPSLAHRYLLKAACVTIRDYFQNLDAEVAERHRHRAAACLPLRILSSPGHAPALRICFRVPDAVGDPDAGETRDSLFVPHQRSIKIRV